MMRRSDRPLLAACLARIRSDEATCLQSSGHSVACSPQETIQFRIGRPPCCVSTRRISNQLRLILSVVVGSVCYRFSSMGGSVRRLALDMFLAVLDVLNSIALPDLILVGLRPGPGFLGSTRLALRRSPIVLRSVMPKCIEWLDGTACRTSLGRTIKLHWTLRRSGAMPRDVCSIAGDSLHQLYQISWAMFADEDAETVEAIRQFHDPSPAPVPDDQEPTS